MGFREVQHWIGFMGEMPEAKYLAVLGKWQLRGPGDPEIWAFGREKNGVGGIETEKVGKTQLQRQSEVPYEAVAFNAPRSSVL